MTRRFGPSDEDRAFMAALSDVLAAKASADLLRMLESDHGTYRVDLWPALAGFGVFDAFLSEEEGGAGLGLDVGVLAFEEFGRSCTPGPIVETALVAVPLLVAAGVGEKQTGTETVAGRQVVTAALEPDALVPYADSADAALLVREGQVRLVPRGALRLSSAYSLDPSRPLFAVTWATADSKLITDNPLLIDDSFVHAALGVAAMLVGLSQTVVAKTVAYTTERHQFGRPVGSFQAVQHALADAHVAVDLAAALVRQAGAAQAGEDPLGSDLSPAALVSMARLAATRAADLAAATALQAHGAMGYSHEYGLRHWLTRIWALLPAWGDAPLHRSRIWAALADNYI